MEDSKVQSCRICARTGWWLGFTAAFAVLMAYVFWGTWSTSVAPVMPDCATVHPLDYGTRVSRWIAGWLHSGRFLPTDLSTFLMSPYVWQELQYALAIYFAALGMAYFLRGRGLPRRIHRKNNCQRLFSPITAFSATYYFIRTHA